MQNVRTSPPLSGISNLMKMQGRYGDSELVHMSPMEVKGLSSLGRLTRNPDTGLPEAFSIGGFFRDYVGPALATAAFGPAGGVTYSMANTASKGGDFGDIALAGFTTYAGGKLGEKLGGALGSLGDTAGQTVGTNATTVGAEAGSNLVSGALPNTAEASSAILENIGAKNITSSLDPTLGQKIAGGLKGGLDKIGSGLTSLATDPTKALSNLGSSALETLNDPVKLGGAVGRTLGSTYADSALQLQSQAIPEQVKEAAEIESGFGKTQLNRNPQYSRSTNPLTASQITAAATGAGAPIQYYNPDYISSMGLNEGGGIQDALEAITEKAEELADVSDGEVYFEGMVKGKGDGMSDEIPFSIEGEQPALLSRDEYVLPADVVSALGNGSSNAGAETLDKFMTAVRKKSMGRERQINEIG